MQLECLRARVSRSLYVHAKFEGNVETIELPQNCTCEHGFTNTTLPPPIFACVSRLDFQEIERNPPLQIGAFNAVILLPECTLPYN